MPRGRSPHRPRTRGADNPACVRSRMTSRSNSASEANKLKVSRPCEVVVSIGSFKLFSPTFRAIRSLTRSTMQRSAQSIELPNDQDIAAAQVLDHLGQHRSVTASAAHHLGVDLGAAGLLQCVDLQGDRLILGADACVADFHRHVPSRVVSSLYSSKMDKSNFVLRSQFSEIECAYFVRCSEIPGQFEVTIVFSN